MHDKLSLLIEQLRLRAGQKEAYHDENFTSLLHRYAGGVRGFFAIVALYIDLWLLVYNRLPTNFISILI